MFIHGAIPDPLIADMPRKGLFLAVFRFCSITELLKHLECEGMSEDEACEQTGRKTDNLGGIDMA